MAEATCPGSPDWVTIGAVAKEIYGPANDAIENAYVEAHAGHRDAILTGSQFFYGGNLEVRLPRGAPNKAFGNKLLEELRGLRNQLKPDIIDFDKRAIYEIKSARYAEANPAEVTGQLVHYYVLAEAIRLQHGGGIEPPWKLDNVTWKPPAVLPLPGDTRNKIVCTAATNYSRWPGGLLLYDVRQRAKRSEQDRRVPKRVVVQAFDSDFARFMPDKKGLAKLLKSFNPYYPDFVIIAPTLFRDEWKKHQAAEANEKTRNLMRVTPPFLDPKHPAGQFRGILRGVFITSVVGLTIVAAASLVFIVATAPALAAGAVGATGGGAAAAGAEVISLAAYRALLASPAAKAAAAAAGVILVIATPESGWAGQAQSGRRIALSDVGAMRIVPVEAFKPVNGIQTATSDAVPADFMHSPDTLQGQFKANSSVYFDRKQHTVVGRFAVEYE